MDYDAIVIGGGIAGLTASAYLAKAGLLTLLCEKENACGGLINAFERDGFVYDGGIRALENSGVVFPMLKHLGLEVDFVKNHISIGMENRVVRVNSDASVIEYQALLDEFYPESKEEISLIFEQIKKIMHYMDVQYGIDNPVFLDMKKDREYMLKIIVPWVFKYALTAPKITAMNKPVVDFLKAYTRNQSLLDIITQHFFQETPAFFALSYLKLYLDYNYPLGGTGKLTEKMVAFIKDHQGTIHTNTNIVNVDPARKQVTDAQGNTYGYRRLIWAADLKTFYRILNLDNMADGQVKKTIIERQAEVKDKTGNDSVYTLFLGVDLNKEYFASKHSEHFFYTPVKTGQSVAGETPLQADRRGIEQWLEKFFALTTYEISIPVLRDASMAPTGKTGLIVSVLFDYRLARLVEEMGWYEEFKSFCGTCIINTLEASIYPGLKQTVVQQFSSTPLTISRVAGNTDGAITGWAFTNNPMPAESRLPKIMNSVKTPVPNVFQAGQWTYSPSGLPISILTGKISADKVIQGLKKK
jgi:phytoene dehydrogenase-like protein